jgi:hypothetical protein
LTVLLKPRNRLVNFRLTEDEYGKLAAVCVQKGSPSISECARAAILRLVEREAGRGGPLDGRFDDLDVRVAQLEASLRRLRRHTPGVELEQG